MRKGPSFRLKLALLVGAVTGLCVLLPVSLLWSLTGRGHLQRLDRELADLSLPNLQREHGRNHYVRFEESLRLIGGDAMALWALDTKGGTLHRSANWPASLDLAGLPEPGPLKPREPRPGPARRPEPLPVSEPAFASRTIDGREWRIAATSNGIERLFVGHDLTEFQARLAGERRRLYLIVPAALLVSAALSWWLAGRALRPVERLGKQLGQIDARDLGARLDAAGEDREFRQLAEVFNGMMERLQTSFGQASRFSADASHELRTPLALLHAQLEEGLNHAADGSEEQRNYGKLLGDVARLREITGKLLLLAEADAGKLSLRHERIDLSRMVEEAGQDLRLLAEDRRVEEAIEPDVSVAGDALLIGQVLQNLIANAVRHGAPGGRVRLELAVESGMARFSVMNEGPAIPEDQQERVFERFHRLDPTRGPGGGSGLGLALSREIARAHGGELELAACSPVTFTLRLPLKLRLMPAVLHGIGPGEPVAPTRPQPR